MLRPSPFRSRARPRGFRVVRTGRYPQPDRSRLDNAGRNIRNTVDSEIARGQVDAQDRDLLVRVMHRVEWDKQLVGSTVRSSSNPIEPLCFVGRFSAPL